MKIFFSYLVLTRNYLVRTRNYLVLTRKYLVRTRNFLVLTRNYLVRTRKNLVLTRKNLVRTRYYLVLTRKNLVLTRKKSRSNEKKNHPVGHPVGLDGFVNLLIRVWNTRQASQRGLIVPFSRANCNVIPALFFVFICTSVCLLVFDMDWTSTSSPLCLGLV